MTDGARPINVAVNYFAPDPRTRARIQHRRFMPFDPHRYMSELADRHCSELEGLARNLSNVSNCTGYGERLQEAGAFLVSSASGGVGSGQRGLRPLRYRPDHADRSRRHSTSVTNRQLHTTSDTVDSSKVEVLRERFSRSIPSALSCDRRPVTRGNIDKFEFWQTTTSSTRSASKCQTQADADALLSAPTRSAAYATGGAGGLTDPRPDPGQGLTLSWNDPLLAKVRSAFAPPARITAVTRSVAFAPWIACFPDRAADLSGRQRRLYGRSKPRWGRVRAHATKFPRGNSLFRIQRSDRSRFTEDCGTMRIGFKLRETISHGFRRPAGGLIDGRSSSRRSQLRFIGMTSVQRAAARAQSVHDCQRKYQEENRRANAVWSCEVSRDKS